MNEDQYSELREAMVLRRAGTVRFAEPSPTNVPTAQWIEAAEAHLGNKLPDSYIWFIKHFVAPEILGYEVHTVMQPEMVAYGADVSSMTMKDRADGWIKPTEISVLVTDYGERFVLDCAEETLTGEYGVFLYLGRDRQFYAQNFGSFIVRYLNEHCPL